jgi:hypothetical protein
MPEAERTQLLQAFKLAVENENRLMALTRGKPPGHPEHDRRLWSELLAAMDATHRASKALQDRTRD